MRYRILFFSLFLFLIFDLNAQTIITGTVTDSLNNPIPSASVYLSKTTIGTLSDNKGVYVLSVPHDGVYELITSSVGYISNSQYLDANGKKQTINVKLFVNLIQLNEVTINSRDKNRLRNYTQFVKLFLGETSNSDECKILNPRDLHFYKDDQNKILKGFSIKPLKIENKALGYIINYDLIDFSFSSETRLLRFKGSYYFTSMNGTPRENKWWTRNRLSAYFGSNMHLLRSVFSDSLNCEDYKIFECSMDTVSGELHIVKPLQESNLRLTKKNNYMTLYYDKPVLVTYTNNHTEIATGLAGLTPQKVTSTITFSDSLNVYQNGYYDKPYAITWGGIMANKRIADMLPYDFIPRPFKKVKSDIDMVTISPIEKYLLSQQKDKCNEQVFVQTDRNMYSQGDTVFFQAYIRNRFTNSFESGRGSLYVLLFNDKLLVADSSRFKIEKSLSTGFLTIASNAESGKYHLIAFTGNMQNHDPADAVRLDIMVRRTELDREKIGIEFDKLNYLPGDTILATIKIMDTNGQPVSRQAFTSSLITGNSTSDPTMTITNYKGESEIRFVVPDSSLYQPMIQISTQKDSKIISITKDFAVPYANQYLEMKFLPEGGTFVEGLDQRIGFVASGFNGEPVLIKGLLKNRSGIILDTIKSGTYGPGLFICTPEQGMYVELINAGGRDKIWKLPVPESKGICLSVRPINDRSFVIEIQSDNYIGDQITVSGIMGVIPIFSKVLVLDKKQHITIETDQLSCGVAQITLFDKELRPLAERLFYVNADKHLNFNVKTASEINMSGQESELIISASDGSGKPVEGIFSISVADSASGHENEIFTPGIEYTYNYYPYFLANLPSKVLIKGVENLTNQERDLLFMIYGWCRYNWDFKEKEKNVAEPQNFDLLNMKILYTRKSQRSDRRLDLVSLEGPSIKHLVTNSSGEISTPLDSLPEITRSVTLIPDPKNKNRVMGAMLSIPFNEQYFRNVKRFRPLPSLRSESCCTSDNSNNSNNSNNISITDRTIEIQEVTIKGRSDNKKVFHDKYEEMYQHANVKSLDYELIQTSCNLEEAIRRLVTPRGITKFNIWLTYPRSFFGSNIPALIVLDGLPLFQEGWDYVRMIPTSEIKSLTILTGHQGVIAYGNVAAGGVIFVNTMAANTAQMKIITEWKLQNSKDKMLIPINIFRAEKEYYRPSKFDIENDPVFQNHSTILWQSEVYFNGKDPVKIKYNNLKHKGQVIITINGAAVNNSVGTGNASYRVY